MTGKDFQTIITNFINGTRVTKGRAPSSSRQSPVPVRYYNFGYGQKKIWSVPTQTSHKLQPLNRSVFRHFKKFTNSTSESYIRNNPGKTISIYDIHAILKQALPNAPIPKKYYGRFLFKWTLGIQYRHIS